MVMARTEMMSAAKRWGKSVEVQTHAGHREEGAGRDTTPSLYPQAITSDKGTALASYKPPEQVTGDDVRPWGLEGSPNSCPSTVPPAKWDGGAKSLYLVLSRSHVLIDFLQLAIMGP